MASINDITGDSLVTTTATDDYRNGWDRIFGKNKSNTGEPAPQPTPQTKSVDTKSKITEIVNQYLKDTSNIDNGKINEMVDAIVNVVNDSRS